MTDENITPREENHGGIIPVDKRTAYRTYCDYAHRTNVGVLVANYPVTSEVKTTLFEKHKGFQTANVDVIYTLNDVDVLTRHCQIIMRPDKSEATVMCWESHFSAAINVRQQESITITRVQFDALAELFGEKK